MVKVTSGLTPTREPCEFYLDGKLKLVLDEAIRRNKKNWDYVVSVAGFSGCLSEDTLLHGHTKSIGELYKSGNIKINTVSKDFRDNQPRRSVSEIIPSGLKEVYEIELENGKKVKATSEHIFFKKEGAKVKEVKVEELKLRDDLICVPENYLEETFKTYSYRRVLKRNRKRVCNNCKSLFYSDIGIGKGNNKYCKTCSKNQKTYRKKYRADAWAEWEKNIIRLFYYSWPDKKLQKELLPHRSIIAIRHKAQELKITKDKKFKLSSSTWTSENNCMHNPAIRKKVSMKLKELYDKHPEKLLNSRLRRDQMTSPEKQMSKILEGIGTTYEWNKYIRTKKTWRFPDFKIGKLVIEVDGEYWHKGNELADLKRQKELEEIGLEVIRFTDKEIKENKEGVKQCILQKLNQLKK